MPWGGIEFIMNTTPDDLVVPGRRQDCRNCVKHFNAAGEHSFEALQFCRWSDFYIDTGCFASGQPSTSTGRDGLAFFFFFITLGLELSDTQVYEPYIRARWLRRWSEFYIGTGCFEGGQRSTSTGRDKCFLCSPFYGRACRWAMLGELNPKGPSADGLASQVVRVLH